IQIADGRAGQGDFNGALQQVEIALGISPEFEDAKQRAVAYKKAIEEGKEKAAREQAAAQIEQAAKERERRPRDYFDQRTRTMLNSPLFDRQEIKVKGNLVDIEKNLARALTNKEPAFQMQEVDHPIPETFYLRAKLPMKSAGWRRCDLVGGQT